MFYAVSPWSDRNEIPFFGSRLRDTVVFSTFGLIGLCVTIQLLRGRRWAWWSAFVVTALILSIGVLLLVLTLYPRDEFARSEGGFGWFLSFWLMLPSAISLILLILPAVRQMFRIKPKEVAR
jgi:hypothetical protein